MDISDKELIERYLKNGDNRAFELLYNRYRNLLYYRLNYLLPNSKNDVDDLFQKTWMKVIDNLPKYHDKNQFGAWICLIAKNLLIDQIRKNERQGVHLSLDETILTDISDDNSSSMPWYEIEQEDMNTELEDALNQLSDIQKLVYSKRLENLSFKSIASELNMSINTVLSHMSYAKKKLQKYVQMKK